MNEALISLLTLTILEIVLGVDNIIFISILASKVPAKDQSNARTMGLVLGMVVRIILLFGLNFIQQQETPLFNLFNHPISGKDALLIIGGLLLLYQSVHEIHEKLKGVEEEINDRTSAKGWSSIILQMILINVIFSLDSVITAVGMAKELWVMITAVVVSMIIMLMASKSISNFVNENPSIKILALAFLVMIGVSLLAEGFGQHIEKGMIYFAMAFSFTIEMINLKIDKKSAKRPK
jgi:predicted tellurium resistance membrane protein TerC